MFALRREIFKAQNPKMFPLSVNKKVNWQLNDLNTVDLTWTGFRSTWSSFSCYSPHRRRSDPFHSFFGSIGDELVFRSSITSFHSGLYVFSHCRQLPPTRSQSFGWSDCLQINYRPEFSFSRWSKGFWTKWLPQFPLFYSAFSSHDYPHHHCMVFILWSTPARAHEWNALSRTRNEMETSDQLWPMNRANPIEQDVQPSFSLLGTTNQIIGPIRSVRQGKERQHTHTQG